MDARYRHCCAAVCMLHLCLILSYIQKLPELWRWLAGQGDAREGRL